MSDGHDHNGAASTHLRYQSRRGFQRVEEFHLRAGFGSSLRVRGDQAEKPDLDSLEFAENVGRSAAEGLSGLAVDHVGPEPSEARFAHAVEQGLAAEIKLVIAQCRIIEPYGIPDPDHLPALESVRGHVG